MSLALPLRPCRRMLLILAAWTCFCYLVFRVASDAELMSSSARVDNNGGVNTRELLQKVMVETRKPAILTGEGGYSTTEVSTKRTHRVWQQKYRITLKWMCCFCFLFSNVSL